MTVQASNVGIPPLPTRYNDTRTNKLQDKEGPALVLNATQAPPSHITRITSPEVFVRRCSACGTQNPSVRYFGNAYDMKCSECLRGSGDLEE